MAPNRFWYIYLPGWSLRDPMYIDINTLQRWYIIMEAEHGGPLRRWVESAIETASIFLLEESNYLLVLVKMLLNGLEFVEIETIPHPEMSWNLYRIYHLYTIPPLDSSKFETNSVCHLEVCQAPFFFSKPRYQKPLVSRWMTPIVVSGGAFDSASCLPFDSPNMVVWNREPWKPPPKSQKKNSWIFPSQATN